MTKHAYSRLLAGISVAAAGLSIGAAQATTTQVNVNVTATVNAVCNMQSTVTDVQFGVIPAFLGASQAATTPGQVSLQCNKGATVTIDISSGSNSGLGQSGTLRAMKSGTADYISYHIYQPSGLSSVSAGTCGTSGTEWGTNSGGSSLSATSLYSGSGGTRNINLCGAVDAAPAGGYAVGPSYLDVVTVTATYP